MAPQLGASSYCGCREGGKVNGLVVLTKYLLSGCACTSHLDWVAQHTAFQDLEILSGLFLVIRSTTISVIVVPVAIGTLF